MTSTVLKGLSLAVGALATAVVPVVLAAPRPDPGRPDHTRPDGSVEELRDLDDVVAACRASEATGWQLVDEATALVHAMYTHYSCWHLWLRPAASLAAGHGHSVQYNLALGEVLTRLGFDVEAVHASRVRLEHHPWYHVGHSWLRVAHEGRRLDVCASRVTNTAGRVSFVPVTDVRPLTTLTRLDTAVALAPFVVASVWRSWLTGRPIQPWVHRPFGVPVGADGPAPFTDGEPF